jgi:Reverse transcriptase (RNA-dependent DNA polymerase)
MDRTLIVKKIAEICDELNEMYDEDDNVIPEDDDGNQILPKKFIQEDNYSKLFVLVTSAMADLNCDDTDSDDEDDVLIPSVVMNKFSGVPRSIWSLATFYNPDPQDKWENMKGEAVVYMRETSKHEAALIATMYDGNPEPKSYWEALTCPDFSNWWEAMCNESNNMEHKQVWKFTPKASIPTGRKIIGSRWVLARKDDGCYCARCVAKGFSQIPGKDFQENHAPLISDTTLHLLMVIKTIFKLEAGQFDIETAFLYGKLDEDLWMDIPDGYDKYLKEKLKKDIDTTTHCLK